MRDYIKRSWLIILGWFAFLLGLLISIQTGTTHGDVLIPLPLIYVAYRLKGGEKHEWITT